MRLEGAAVLLFVWCSLFVFGIFLGLYLGEGELTVYEHNSTVRLVELILFSGILGLAIYRLVRFIRH